MMKIFDFLPAGVLIAVIAFGSCSTGDAAASAAVQMLGGSTQALLFIDCRAASDNQIEFEFTQPVTVKQITFEPALTVASVENGSTVKVKINESPSPGTLFTADLLAEDQQRNSINVLVPFRSRNNRMPELVINELRTENTKPKAEFIELKMKTAGNLGAIRVYAASNDKNPLIYEFMPVEVKKDEYVVLHLRATEENCRNEYGANLGESGGTDSSPAARDFWVNGNTKLLRKTDAVYLLDQDNNVLDAVMMSENPDAWWSKEHFADITEFLYEKGAWKSADGRICSPVHSVISAKTTNSRTICRDETAADSNTGANWYITVTSGATPGKTNNPGRYSN